MGGTADAALVIGVALALSSTALGLQLVIQRNEQATQLGRTALSILLFQDLVVVPLLVLVPLLGDEVGTLLGKIGMASFKAGVALLIIVVLGRLLLKRLFHWIARSGGTELVTATALLVILGTAAFTQLAGLSLTLGAFLAGLLIAETEYRHQVAADINPFRGLLLGLFFMTVGMSIDLGFLVYEVRLILISVAALMVIKGVILYGLGRLFGVAGPVAIRAAFLLAQGGEFAFILFGMAQFHGVIDNATVQVLLAMVAVSMALTPASAAAGRALAGLMVNRRVADTSVLEHEAERLDGHVVIAGFGRVGQTVGRMLAAQGIPYIALDLSPQRVRDGRLGGLPVFYGDSSRPNLLRAAGVERALAAVVTLDKPEASQRAVAVLRRSNPGLLIYARAHDAAAMDRLDRAGASVVVPETLEASLQLGGQVLRCTGMTEADIDRLFATFREEHYGRLADVIPAKGNAGEEPPDR
jgi:CPA2 family monovalent cation:H+ antiporter-2